jgi:chromosome segregation ATPase
MNKHVALSEPECKPSPWGTPRANLEYELALCDRDLAAIEGTIEDAELEVEVLKENFDVCSKRYDDLKARLSELED